MVPYPALFVCHGGGPLPLLGDAGHAQLVQSLRGHRSYLEQRFGLPRAIAVISAHYETERPKVGGASRPALLYDYYGFPPESYSLRYPVPGDAALAERIGRALRSKSLHAAVEPDRPLDHGVFVPLMIMFPEATIPVVPLSVLKSGDPREHIRLGEALRTLRSDGVLLLGSGSTMHNFRELRDGAGTRFGDALTSVLCTNEVVKSPECRLKAMEKVALLDGFSESQPPGAHEHLMPLLTVVGSSEGNLAEEVANVPFGRANVRNYLFVG